MKWKSQNGPYTSVDAPTKSIASVWLSAPSWSVSFHSKSTPYIWFCVCKAALSIMYFDRRLPSCLWRYGMEGGTTSASPGPHGTANGRRIKMVRSWGLATTWQRGTRSNPGESSFWGRSRWGGAVGPWNVRSAIRLLGVWRMVCLKLQSTSLYCFCNDQREQPLTWNYIISGFSFVESDIELLFPGTDDEEN